LQEIGLSENTRHATNFTWRLNQDAFEAVRQRGVNLVNSFQKNKSNTDVKEHFEKYLLSLEDTLVIVVYVCRSANYTACSPPIFSQK
jgi:hypothetical protein